MAPLGVTSFYIGFYREIHSKYNKISFAASFEHCLQSLCIKEITIIESTNFR